MMAKLPGYLKVTGVVLGPRQVTMSLKVRKWHPGYWRIVLEALWAVLKQ